MTALTITLASPAATQSLAQSLAPKLRPGDCLLLSGPIGAGKTLFCRFFIQSLLDQPEDIPSPTFTLVQTYETQKGEVWHTDLYRLAGPADAAELGLFDAFEEAICLVEWPDRLGQDAPESALWLTFEPDPETPDKRTLRLNWTDPKWADRLEHIADD